MPERADYQRPLLTPITAEVDRLLNTSGIDNDVSLTYLAHNWFNICQDPSQFTDQFGTDIFDSAQLFHVERLGELLAQWVKTNRDYSITFHKGAEPAEMQRHLEADTVMSEIELRNMISLSSALTDVVGVKQFVVRMSELGFFDVDHLLSTPGQFIRDDAVAGFLAKHPPAKTLTNSPLTLNEALDQYGPRVVFSLARNVEDQDWQEARREFISSIDPSDTEARPIQIEVVDREAFPEVTAVLDKKTARDDNPTGIVYTIPLRPEVAADTHRVAYLRLASRLLHYLYEVYIYDTVYSRYLLASSRGESEPGVLFGSLFWRGMRKRDPDGYYFGTHSLSEALYWRRAYETIIRVVADKLPLFSHYNHGSNKLLMRSDQPGQPETIGFHPLDTISTLHHGPDYEKPYVHTKREVKLFLLQSLLQLSNDELTEVIVKHLAQGHIGL